MTEKCAPPLRWWARAWWAGYVEGVSASKGATIELQGVAAPSGTLSSTVPSTSLTGEGWGRG